MNPGIMDRKIEFQRNTATRDATGGDVESWATLTTQWARVQYRDESGTEQVQSDRRESRSFTLFTIYYNSVTSGITEADRVLFDSKYYSIVQVAEVQRRDLLKITTQLTK